MIDSINATVTEQVYTPRSRHCCRAKRQSPKIGPFHARVGSSINQILQKDTYSVVLWTRKKFVQHRRYSEIRWNFANRHLLFSLFLTSLPEVNRHLFGELRGNQHFSRLG